jgi:histidinol-phosphate aminotransferase
MESGIKKLGLQYIPSQANFILVDVGNGQKTFEKLQKKGVITRPMPKELSNYLRISIGTERENDKVLTELNYIVSSSNIS